MPRKLLVGGVQRSSSVKGVKKVAPPVVPTLNVKAAQFKKSPCICNGDDQLTIEFGDCDSDYSSYTKPPRSPSNGTNNFIQPFFNSISHPSHPMKKMTPGGGSNGQIHLAHVIVHSQPDSLPSTPSDTGHSPSLSKGRLMSGTQVSLEDQGIDMNSPGRHSPGGSSGGSSISRHSLSSLDSGRASGPGSDGGGKAVNRRLSIQSYEGSSPQRRSYHSSSSSIASVGDDLGPGPNVAEMVLHGLPDVEVLSSWLATLHFEEYIPLFLLAGYDMPTITRMTPEDLTAIGITKPNHRRKLKAEIGKLNISDGIPEYKPHTLFEWLQLLRLEEYYDTLCQQNYNTIDKVTDLTWEDLEDIGIQKLGHQKRILLAIKRIEDINHGRRPNLYPQSNRLDSGSSTFPRPSTLSNAQPPLHYPSQEIAIATQRPKSSPSTESIPELKTFQQSPIREDNLFLQALHNSAQNTNSAHSSAQSFSMTNHNSVQNTIAYNSPQTMTTAYDCTQNTAAAYNSMQTSTTSFNAVQNNTAVYSSTPKPTTLAYNSTQNTSVVQNSVQNSAVTQGLNGVPNCVVSPTRGKSLESLSSENNTQVTNNAVIPTSTSCTTVQQTQVDSVKNTTKDWHVTDLDQEYDYECEGTATLNRPKGMVKLRPMAKITAKTREEIAEAIMDIPDSEFKSLINNQSRTLDGWSSLDGSPRHGPSTVPRSATLRRAPPPVPKRSNSAKGDKPPAEPPKESAVARLRINPAKSNTKPIQEASNQNSEHFPPPPLPLPSAAEEKSNKEDAEKEPADELFNNPLFRQRRKDSSESSSSMDSAALPFANEAVGTIKQKTSRPYPALPIDTNHHKGNKISKSRVGAENNQSNADHEYDMTCEAVSPGDVIDDIENMLANLSDQLDAMLDDEAQK